MKARPTSSRAGFSLVEFLMVAIILGVGLLGLAALTTTAMRSYGGSRTRDAAIDLCASVMDRLAVDGRMSAELRMQPAAIPATALVANAVDGNVNTFTDAATNLTTFDLQGQPSATAPIFTVNWIRRAPKVIAPDPSSRSAVSEVVVNVQWSEAVKNATTGVSTAQPHYISASRIIRY